jgi:hypothetical protein
MKTEKPIKGFVAVLGWVILLSLLFPKYAQAEVLSSEYKCTTQCTLCINYSKKTVCSSHYPEDGDEFIKAKKLSKFVNEGMVIPDDKLKPGFDLNSFAAKYFNCELMIKKAKQLAEATQNMCVTKTVNYKKTMLVPRSPASVRKSRPLPVEED